MSHGVLVAPAGELEQAVVAAVDRTEDLVVVRRCADVAELLAAALAGLGPVAVIDAALDPDRSLVARLAQAGTAAVVVCAPSDRDRYAGMGARVATYADGVDGVVGAASDAATQVPAAAEPAPPAGTAGTSPLLGRGGMVVVWGPSGSPGRTTVAINLAAEIAASGTRALLVDADLWGASVAPLLGLLEESAGLAAAVRAADHGTLDEVSLARLCARVSDRLLVLPGLPRASRWREVSAVAVDVVWQQAALLAEWVVVDAATWVPDDEVAGFDAVLGPRRNAVTASAMAAADHLVVVGAAEPIGIQRLVQALLDLEGRGAVPPRRHVVVTRLRADAAGPRPADSVREALHRFAGVDDVLLVPDDRAVHDRAALAGASLAEVAPRSPAREAIVSLATLVTGRTASHSRRRRSRAR